MEVPGSQGWAFAGDKSLEFAKSPLVFVDKRLKALQSQVFYARALNKPTVFVTSYKGVREILIDKFEDFDMGYMDFGYIYSLYGDMLIFFDGENAQRLRKIIKHIFSPTNCHMYHNQIECATTGFLNDLGSRPNIHLYAHFKEFTTALCLYMFMDIDWRSDKTTFSMVKSIATMHWHGLYSVPLTVKFKGWKSSFGKAMEAREYLLKAINEKVRASSSDETFLSATKEAGFESESEAANHLLLFVSALIPKALSSLMTSFCLVLSGDKKQEMREKALTDDDYLDYVLMEVQRLWPPFLGGRRISNKAYNEHEYFDPTSIVLLHLKDSIVDGYRIPANTPVAYLSWFANRDVSIFEQPTLFKPERWIGRKEEFREQVWTFGGGPRGCVGINFINGILKTSCKLLLREYDWSCDATAEDIPYKTLPVARPRDEIKFKFKAK